MRAAIYILVLLVCSISTFGQIKFALSTGYGTYSMNNMKGFQEELLSGFPEDAKITESFPGFLYYEASVTKLQNDKFVIGGYLTYGSTGGRIHYGDYSGEVSSNQLIRYVTLGAPLGIMVGDPEKTISVHLDARPHFTYGILNLEFYTRIGNQSEKESYKFASFNFGVEPGVSVEKKFKERWRINFFAGYNLTLIPGQLMFSEEEDVYLQDENGEEVQLNFTGLRIGLGISYSAF